MRGAFPVIGGGRAVLTAVHAGSVAHGAVLAGTSDVARGRVYNLTNDAPVAVDEFMRLAAEGLGVRLFRPRIPYAVGAAAGALLKGALIASGKRALTPHVDGFLTMLTSDNPFSSERARSELGWHPAPRPEVVIPEAFRWWRNHAQPQRGAAHGNANATT
jgi:nucleoside-diphosphate-sugar epimerase